MFWLSSLLALSAVNALTPLPNYLKCESIDIAGLVNTNVQTTCKLAVAPKDKVTVHLQPSNGVQIAPCTLSFDAKDWDTAKPVMLQLPSDMTNYSFTYKIEAPKDQVHLCGSTYSGSRYVPDKPGLCNIVGDPHIITFGQSIFSNKAKEISVYEEGDFWLIKSEQNLFAIGRYGECGFGPNAACMTAIYIQYQDSGVMIDAKNDQFAKRGVDSPDFKVEKKGKVYQVTIKDYKKSPSVITITDEGAFLGMVANLSPVHYKQVSGHCNVWDKDVSADTLMVSRTQPAKNLAEWIKAYKLEDNDPLNCLRSNKLLPKIMPALTGVQYKTCPAIPSLDKKCTLGIYEQPICGCEKIDDGSKATSTVPATSTVATSTKATETAKATEAAKPDQYSGKSCAERHGAQKCSECRQECMKFFGLAEIEANVTLQNNLAQLQVNISTSFAVDMCAADLANGKLNHDFSRTHLEIWGINAKIQMEFVVENAKEKAAANPNNTELANRVKTLEEQVAQIRDVLGMGNNTCPNSCNGRGECTEYGCQCPKEYGGLDCGQKFVISKVENSGAALISSVVVLLVGLVATL